MRPSRQKLDSDVASGQESRKHRIGLLVKNGIGLGHIRRAILVGQELVHTSSVQPFIISQASSLELLRRGGVSTINLPLIERLPSNAAEVAYARLLDEIIERLRLDLIVEDTYPDDRFDQVPAIQSRPRVLLMRRVDPISLDEMCRTGQLAPYRRILLADSAEGFAAESHTGFVRQLVGGSGRFEFVGPVTHQPLPTEIAAAHAAYGGLGRLVVVSAGGGGNHFDDGYCGLLFSNALRAARAVPAAHFVFVYGPYFPGLDEPLPENVTAVRFEPNLAALLHVADVAIIRPGHNVLAEARAGHARIIMVPGISWMETQSSLAGRLAAADGGVYVASVGYQTDAFPRLVEEAMHAPPRTPSVAVEQGQRAAAVRLAAIAAENTRDPDPLRRKLLLLFRLPRSCRAEWERALRDALNRVWVAENCPDVSGLDTVQGDGTVAGLLETATPDALDRTTAPPAELGLLLVNSRLASWAASWLAYHGRADDIPLATFSTVRDDSVQPMRVIHRVAELLRHEVSATVCVDLTRITTADRSDFYATKVAAWLRQEGVTLAGTDGMRRYLRGRALNGGHR